MKKIIIVMVSLLITQIIQAQGTITYLSNLNQTPTGSNPVGSDSWVASEIITGNNPSGYLLDSVQLEMMDASDDPSGFIAMLYSAVAFTGINPGSSLGTLDGSLNPVDSGIFTYTPDTDITLSPSTYYFIVVTAGTTVANGAYEWSTSASYGSSSGGWGALSIIYTYSASNLGNFSNFNYIEGIYGQFALTATAIPEPSSALLLLFGSGVFIYVRRTFHR